MFNKFNNKIQILETQLVNNNINLTDKQMLRLAIQSEYDAINLYEHISDKTKNKKMSKVMLDIAREEKVHVGELEELLKILDNEFETALKDGKNEI